jgi:hypothetical protein
LFLFSAGPLKLQARTLQPSDTNDATELWGGNNIRMHLSAQGATFEFDCAEGKILEPVKPASNGEFSARGTYTPAHFGPVRKDNPPRELPAVYKGKISGDTMQLEILVPNSDVKPPTFNLTKGKDGRVVRCY